MKTRLILATIAAMGSMGLAVSAHATTYSFSYTVFPGDVLTGMLTGSLEGDGNTIDISSIYDGVFGGSPGAPIIGVTTLPTFDGVSGFSPQTSLDGSINEFLACANLPACSEGFLIDTSGIDGGPIFASSPSYGGVVASYDPSAWSISAAGVPEPAVWAIMLAGFGLVGAGLRQRRRQDAAATA